MTPEAIDAHLADHREQLCNLGIRAALLRAETARLCQRSRWEARRGRWLLQQHVLRGVVTKMAPTRRKSDRRRSRARLVVVG